MTNLHSLNGLLEDLSDSRKIRGFHLALEDDTQPSASYKLPIGDASANIVGDIDYRVSSMSSVISSRKVSKLLQYPGVCSRKFYHHFKGENLTKGKALYRHVTDLTRLRSFDNLYKTDVIWSSTKAEEMEAVLCLVVDGLVDLPDEVIITEVH